MASPNLSYTPELTVPAGLGIPAGSGWAAAAAVAATGLACFVAQWISVELWAGPARMSAVWLPGGLMLAVAIRTEPRRWPEFIAAAMAGTILAPLAARSGPPPTSSIALDLLAGLLAVALAAALRAVAPQPLALRSLREFTRYLVVAVLGGTIAASILYVALVAKLDGRPPAFPLWRAFTLSALSAYLVATPTLVMLAEAVRRPTRLALGRWHEAAILALLLVLACGLVFVNRSEAWTAFAMALPALLLWAALRFGPLGASASLLLVMLTATPLSGPEPGPSTRRTPSESPLPLQLFLLGTGLPLLGLAAVLAEGERTTAALEASHARLKGINHELMAAREEEASRIARELHDDVGQRLALLSIGLSRMRQRCANDAPGCAREVGKLQEQAGAIGRSLREISHQLHPATLEHVGLAAALQLQCEEMHQASGLGIRLVESADTSAVPRDVALCLYRVAQEALNNVIRHSGAHAVEVALHRTRDELTLRVSDDGRGFVPSAPERRAGLGLVSAAERVTLVRGTLAVDSAPGAGTTLQVVVPLGALEHA